jgi:hypothetical protein
MYYLDTKYLGLLSHKLRDYKEKSGVWQIRCPQPPFGCDDISRGRVANRGFFFRVSDQLLYKCHHCGLSVPFQNFLKNMDELLYKEYLFEMLGNTKKFNSTSNIKSHTPLGSVELKTTDIAFYKDSLIPIKELPVDNPAHKYLLDRLIPKDKFNLFYLALKHQTFINKLVPNKFYNTKNDYPRLIIPFYDQLGRLMGVQARAFFNETPKYLTIKIDENAEKIFGLERVNLEEPMYVVEGAIDSLFLPNCVAVNGASFDVPFVRRYKDKCTLIVDNEPRKKEIVKQIKKYVDKGYKICILPSSMKGKDINEYIKNGYTQEQIIKTINENTYQGLEADIVFHNWNKCRYDSSS